MITSSVYWIFTKLDHRIALWKGKNPIYFGVITIILFDNLYRQAYFVMHTFLVSLCEQTSNQSDDKISLAHALYTFKLGDKITK